MNFFLKNQRGQSLLEVTVAVAIFGLIGAALATLSVGGFSALNQGGEETQANALSQEGIEAVIAIRDSAWNVLTLTQSAVTSTGDKWSWVGEGTVETIGKYQRTITLGDVCRDNNFNVVNCPEGTVDIGSKRVLVKVAWEPRPNTTNEIWREEIFTNWDSRDWVQNDWSGGSGQEIWQEVNKYSEGDSNVFSASSTSGTLQLAPITSSTEEGEIIIGYQPSAYLISSAFNMLNNSPVQMLSWEQDLSACTSSCAIKLQLRLASDNGGAPGAWRSWLGAEGENSFFTNNQLTLLPPAFNGKQWMQYRVELTGDGNTTPIFKQIKINFK